jgi:hypothetical protein
MLSSACRQGTSVVNTTETYMIGTVACQLWNNLNNSLDISGLHQNTIGDVPWNEIVRIVNANINLINQYQV